MTGSENSNHSVDIQLAVVINMLNHTQSLLCSIISDGKENEGRFNMHHQTVIESLLMVQTRLEKAQRLTEKTFKECLKKDISK